MQTENKEIKVTVHIPNKSGSQRAKINRIYDILKPIAG